MRTTLICLAGAVLAGPPVAGVAVASAPVACRVELDRLVLPVETPQKAVIRVTLDAGAFPAEAGRAPVNLAVVLDRSGSMRGEKLARAKDAAIEALRRLNGNDLFSLVVYDDTVKTVVPAQSAANADWIEGRIREIGEGGQTALFGGVSQAAAELRKHLDDRHVHRIILLSDGLANVGPRSPDELGRLGTALIKEGISVTTVGVGTDYNEDLMANLARRSDGNTYFAASGKDLPRIFGAEIGDVLSVVAKKVNVRIECTPGARPLRIIGRDGRIRGQSVELYLNQLYGEQEKFALVELELAAGRAGEIREVATARVTFDDPLTGGRGEAVGRAAARFSDDRLEIASNENSGVQRVLQLNRNALAQDRAIALADEGKVAQAVAELRRSAGDLKAEAERLGDADLLQRAREMAQQADRLEAAGLTPQSRKTMRAEAQQEMMQQSAR